MRLDLRQALFALPLLLATGPALAFGPATGSETQAPRPSLLGKIFNGGAKAEEAKAPVRLAQVSDPRLVSLEEQVRNLNGKIEELNFLILQMQEQMRKQQEDIDFRLQELEGGNGGGERRTDAGTTETAPRAAPAGSQTAAGGTAPAGQTNTAGIPPASGATQNDQTIAGVIDGTDATTNDLPGVPRSLGSIRFDERGNLIGGTVEEPVDLLGTTDPQSPATDGTDVAALPSTDDPEELYRNSYEFILSGDYKAAEAGFRSYIDRFPDQNRVADANFWLGESLAGQNRHRDAAEIFLAASRDHPDSKKAPDTLLKLGMSLAAMKQREVACATFREVNTRYPNASDALKERVRQEVATNGC